MEWFRYMGYTEWPNERACIWNVSTSDYTRIALTEQACCARFNRFATLPFLISKKIQKKNYLNLNPKTNENIKVPV